MPTLSTRRTVSRRLSGTYRFTFAHGIVANDRQAARVTHIDGGLSLSADEWAALDGARAEFVGGRHFRVNGVLVEVADAFAAPYGTPIRWVPLARAA